MRPDPGRRDGYVAYSSYADTDPYHGWIIGFDAATLQPLTNQVFNTTPNATRAVFGPHAGEGALWMGGDGLCVDAHTNLYFEVANGSFDADTGGGDYGDSFMRLSTAERPRGGGLFHAFQPGGHAVGGRGFRVGRPGAAAGRAGSAAHPHLIVGAGKESKVYLVDRDNMGHYNPQDDRQIVQSVRRPRRQSFQHPGLFQPHLYYQGIGGVMKAFAISNGLINPEPLSESPDQLQRGRHHAVRFGQRHARTPSSGRSSRDGAVRNTPAVLHAYNATNLADRIIQQQPVDARTRQPRQRRQNDRADGGRRQGLCGGAKRPGHFRQRRCSCPAELSPAGGDFTNSVTVTLADADPDATIYYTLDGSAPTAASARYTGPLTLTKTLKLQAIAIKPGAVNSGVAAAAFVNTAAAGHGTGLVGQYWAGGDDRDRRRPAGADQTRG